MKTKAKDDEDKKNRISDRFIAQKSLSGRPLIISGIDHF
jgi:hypothetical protein